MCNYAPIMVSVYDRIATFKECITALQNCENAEFTDLFVVSDAAQSPSANNKVSKIREFCDQIQGFRSVNKIYREINLGSFESITSAEKEILQKYGRIIVLEDDVVVSNNFLNYMNEMLNKFENHKEIFSISAYSPPNLNDVINDFKVFTANMHCPWGYATWLDRYSLVNPQKNNLLWFRRNKLKTFLIALKNPHLINALIDDFKHPSLGYADVRITSQMLELGLYSVYPNKSLTRNIGNDGTGTRGARNKKLHYQKIYNGDMSDIKMITQKKKLQKKIFSNGANFNKDYLKNFFKILVKIW